MHSSLIDVLPDLLELLVFGLSNAGFFLVDTYIERFAFIIFGQGSVEIVAWAAVMGAVALYFAYNVGIDKVRLKLRDVCVALV